MDFNHLKKVQSNYFKHFIYAMYFNVLALLVFTTGTIHAIFPPLFAFAPYNLAKKITDGTEKHFKKRD
jgi:ABC-type long-subunit fatty acid transport system fused permease/ATPase subunit